MGQKGLGRWHQGASQLFSGMEEHFYKHLLLFASGKESY